MHVACPKHSSCDCHRAYIVFAASEMSSPHELYDVAVIGGGLIGCAVLRELATAGYCSILLEKNNSVLMGASAGNR